MKTRKLFIGLLVTLFCIIFLTGCGSKANELYDTGVTYQQEYENYDAWEGENAIELVIGVEVVGEEEFDSSGVETQRSFDIPNKYAKKIQNLREGIITFFNERYQIDVSEQIENQEIAIFNSYGANAETFGYVDPENQNILNLNQKVFKEDSDKFESTYIHETLHQIGFISSTPTTIDEGITDALTDMICCYLGIEPVLTEYYFETRTVAYQLLKADPGIVTAYLTEDGFSIIDRINDKLENIPQVYEKTDNLGQFLDYMLRLLLDLATGKVPGYSVDPYCFAFQAQEIVKAYCQECKPDAETIDYIRAHYLTMDCEYVTVKQDDYGYYFE